MEERKSASSMLEGFAARKLGGAVEEEEEGPGPLAGKAFSKAVASGSGQAIWDAFAVMMREYDEGSATEEEPVAEDASEGMF